MNNEKYASYSFRMGSIIGGMVFLYYILMSWIGNPMTPVHLWVYMTAFVLCLVFSLVRYRQRVAGNVKYGRYLAIGTLINLIVTCFLTLFYIVYIIKIDPAYIQKTIDESVKILENRGMEQIADMYKNEGMYKLIQICSIIGWFIQEFFLNFLITLVVALVVRKTSPRIENEDN